MVFPCAVCGGQHTRQVFVSHSRADVGLLEEIKNSLCAARISPFLYQAPINAPASWEIMGELLRSMALMIVLGPEVVHRSWTQVWIGFEIGAFAAFQLKRDMEHPPLYNIPHTFLVEDVRQSNNAPVPYVDLALLIDFQNPTSWAAVRSVAEMIKDDAPLERESLARANDLRLFKLFDHPDFHCVDPHCMAKYELLIWVGDCNRDSFGFPILPDAFSLRCIVCRKDLDISVSPAAPGVHRIWSITIPHATPHISSFFGLR